MAGPEHIPLDQLLEAMNDEEASERLMKEHNIDKRQLVAQAERTVKKLTEGMGRVNVV